MANQPQIPLLKGKKALVVGIANEHSIAFAPKADLQGGLLNCSAAGFAQAMDISCHSFIRMDVGFTCAFLATRYARRLTGSTVYVDGGVNIMA